jgi:hypothetical protein
MHILSLIQDGEGFLLKDENLSSPFNIIKNKV